MRLVNIIASLKKGEQLLWRQCAHDDLDNRVSAVECRRLRALPCKYEARYGIGQQPPKQRMRHGVKVDIGDDLLLPGCLQQRGHDGETTLCDGREKQGAELREAWRLGDNHTHQGQIPRLAYHR